MRKRESLFKLVTDERILILIVGIAILWRRVISADETISFCESACSGITLSILGWVLFAYMYSTSRKPTDWPVTRKIYQGIAASLLVLNSYVDIYADGFCFPRCKIPHVSVVLLFCIMDGEVLKGDAG
jgi:hypothetical protein